MTDISKLEAALKWFSLGYRPIPCIEGQKNPRTKFSSWLDDLSESSIRKHWSQYPNDEVALLCGDDLIVFDADGDASLAALTALEKQHGMEPVMVVQTAKGRHHYYRQAEGLKAKLEGHSTHLHPERIDVRYGNGYILTVPSTGKSFLKGAWTALSDLGEASQPFVDALSVHNGHQPSLSKATEGIDEDDEFVPDESSADASRFSINMIKRLRAMLAKISSDCGRSDWIKVMAAVHHTTEGSDEGLALVDEWSSTAHNYKGFRDVERNWRSFRRDQGDVATVGTIIGMLQDQGLNWIDVCAADEEAEEPFEVVDTVVNKSKFSSRAVPNLMKPAPISSPVVALAAEDGYVDPMLRFSLLGHSARLKERAEKMTFVMDGMAMMGECTAIYAAPNSGKTLLTIWTLINSIKAGRIDPSKLFYINADDAVVGLFEKVTVAETYGFHMIVPGENEFHLKMFESIVEKYIQDDMAVGRVFVLDTLKKFADVMDKKAIGDFNALCRRFSAKGGTVIALTHTNKSNDQHGNPVAGGTSDVIDDFGTVWILKPKVFQGKTKVIAKNKKRRGNVKDEVEFSYVSTGELNYHQRLASVRMVEDDFQIEPSNNTPDPAAEIVKRAISEGQSGKMDLVKLLMAEASMGRNAANEYIEQMTDKLWTVSTGPRGRKIYTLISKN